MPLRVLLIDRSEVQPGQRLVSDVLKCHPTFIAEEKDASPVDLEIWPATGTAREIMKGKGKGKEREEVV